MGYQKTSEIMNLKAKVCTTLERKMAYSSVIW